jgi:hypothetical protein
LVHYEEPTSMEPADIAAEGNRRLHVTSDVAGHEPRPGVDISARRPGVQTESPRVGGSINNTLPITSITSTGVIAVVNGGVRVKGTYKGDVTIVAMTGSNQKNGNVWIDGDIVANTNPALDQTSSDRLGLVSQRMTHITKDLSRTSSSVLNIQAAIYTENGTFAAQEYSSIPPAGVINLYGALAMSASTSTRWAGGGFRKSFKHDPRFDHEGPAFFPVINSYHSTTWWEK